jgi:serine/threonine protein phosphatase 1
MARTFVIGDIHGALKALDQVIAKLKLKADDTLIFLGDYVDGWSQSAQVIERLMQLETQYHCIFIKGNHDAWVEGWLRGEPSETTWLNNGGAQSIASYEHIDAARRLVHLNFYERMPGYYIDDENRLFIHAGFTSMHGPERERFTANYYWDRTLWEMAIIMDMRVKKHSKLYPKRLLLYKEIYIGHTPTINYDVEVPMHACNVWNVDTGAAFYGRISALNIKTKKFWQSDPVRELYPDEQGRNKD